MLRMLRKRGLLSVSNIQHANWMCVCLLAVLTGCATQKDASGPDSQQLTQVTSWTAQGKLAYDVNGQRGNFSFRWIQSNHAYEIVLFGPLGISVATITGNEVLAKITTSEGQMLSAPRPEQLLQETLGLDMPVSAMTDWLRGVPRNTDTSGKIEGSTKKAVEGFNELGWQVEVQRRDKSMNPSRVRISRPGANFLVIVKGWSY